jgi:uncharacterized protein YcbK (DUF882 family)
LLERRRLLQLGFGAALAGAIGTPTLGWAQPLTDAETRSVGFHNLHTGESMECVYWEGGDYIPDVLDAVNNLLRDHRTGDIYPIDPKLLDLLDAVNAATGTKASFQVISGYRSPKTNEMLHERSAEVAKKSLHTEGLAIDVRLVDVDLSRLHAAAISLGRGGVGYYPYSDFVHLDVGPTRTWYGT